MLSYESELTIHRRTPSTPTKYLLLSDRATSCHVGVSGSEVMYGARRILTGTRHQQQRSVPQFHPGRLGGFPPLASGIEATYPMSGRCQALRDKQCEMELTCALASSFKFLRGSGFSRTDFINEMATSVFCTRSSSAFSTSRLHLTN